MSPPFSPDAAGSTPRRSAGEFPLAVVAAAGLGYDAYAHFDLADNFDANIAVLSQGTVFRIDAVFAALAGLLVLITRRRAATIFAVLVAGGALGAVLLYRYVNLGVLGPLPNMYEPGWYLEKTFSAVAEAVAVLAAGSLLFLPQYPK
ncbi:MAG: hypothetical protein ACRDQ4_14365 [Pseudonocardiaceae bacterium]